MHEQTTIGVHEEEEPYLVSLRIKYINPARGIPDFCKQKLLALPLEPSTHLGHYNNSEFPTVSDVSQEDETAQPNKAISCYAGGA